MTGKDLFASLNFVDDALIEEAENYTPARILPMRTVHRVGALAACFCLLVCLAVLIRSGMFGAGSAAPESMMDTVAKDIQMESSNAAAAVTEEAAAEEAEAETAVESVEEAAPAEGAESAQGSGQPAEDASYYIINKAKSADDKTEVTQPENGEWVCEFGLRKQVMDVLRIQITPSMAGGTGKEARFLATFRLTKDGEHVDPDSAEYLAEVQRLTDLGYEFRTLYVEGETKDIKVCICGLFTAEQLDEFDAREFDASEEYGYIFYFPKNEDGTPLDWDNKAELPGLPTADDTAQTE